MKGLNCELRITTHVFKAIKETPDKRLLQYGLNRCWACKGTGLQDVVYFDGSYSWSGKYCKTCKGTGLTGKLEDYLKLPLGENYMYICKQCLGEGCKQCNYMGLGDWLQRLTNFDFKKRQTNDWYLQR